MKYSQHVFCFLSTIAALVIALIWVLAFFFTKNWAFFGLGIVFFLVGIGILIVWSAMLRGMMNDPRR